MNVLPADFDLALAATTNRLRSEGIDATDYLQADAEMTALLRAAYADVGRPAAREEAA